MCIRQERSREAQNLLSGGGGCRLIAAQAASVGAELLETTSRDSRGSRSVGRIASCSLRSPRSARRHQRFRIETSRLSRAIPGVVSVAQESWPLLGNTNNSFIAVNGEVNPEQASMAV